VYTIIKSHDLGTREEPAKFATPLSYSLGHHFSRTPRRMHIALFKGTPAGAQRGHREDPE